MACKWVGWALLGITLIMVPFVLTVGVHVPICTSFLALACALLGKKNVLLRYLSALVFLVIGIGSVALFYYYALFHPANIVQDLSSAITSRDPELVKRKISQSKAKTNEKSFWTQTLSNWIACVYDVLWGRVGPIFCLPALHLYMEKLMLTDII